MQLTQLWLTVQGYKLHRPETGTDPISLLSHLVHLVLHIGTTVFKKAYKAVPFQMESG